MNLYVKETELEKRLLHNNEIYKQKIKLGGEINTLFLEKGIEEGSLEKSDKKLYTYEPLGQITIIMVYISN